MDVHLQTIEDSKGITKSDDLLEEQNSLSLPNTEDFKDVTADISKGDASELEKLFYSAGEDHQLNKNLNVREIHETSPFKQAVKGFVLSKLSKKVGSSHILSGLTEKIVKKLEDKDNSQSVSVHSSESDLTLSNLKTKEASSEDICSSISCELKSVVANDLALSEALSIDEDGVECVEEFKSSNDSIDTSLIPQVNDSKEMTRSNSISLPSSPAHRFIKRASSISYSLDSEDSHKKFSHSPNLTFLCEENKVDECNAKSKKSKTADEIQLKDITTEKHNLNYDIHANPNIALPNNIYVGEKEDIPDFKSFLRTWFSSFFYIFKNAYHTLTLTHFFLLASITIHNIHIIPFFLTFLFDGIIIAYVCYSCVCALVQKPIPNKTSNFPFIDPHLGNASIRVQKSNKFVKGSVKVLKGEYDPENFKNHPTDLVDVSIENSCLKIYTPKKKKDGSTNLHSFTFYDILGTTVSILPKDLSRKRIWNKKYPICIVFPSICEKAYTPDDSNNGDYPSVDYLSPIHDDSSEKEKKALYIFALTDREKESLFWALLKNTEECNDVSTSPVRKTLPKIDFSSMSYTSLLDLNGEDSISQSKEVDDDDSSIVDNANTDLEFESYMKKLFENYERMVKFSPRSRSFEDLSNIRDEIPKSSDSLMSKDDFFLSTVSRVYSVDWLNLVLGRLFYDFLTQKYWSDDVKARIQKKLDKIEMPSFIESLEVSDVFLGTSLPQIHTVSDPVIDINGVWINFDFNYSGSFQMTLKTKLNVTKAKQLPGAEAIDTVDSKQNVQSARSSDSEDEVDTEAKTSSAKKKKIINRIEKWISHKHFQTVAQSRFVKKYVGDLSNMPLTLTVELNTLHGTLTLNIPPAPTDRIWYGFQKDPVLSLNAYPKVGTHEINLSAVVQMIEKKLIQEFKKALVMPNMDDLLIPVMYSPIYEF